MRILLILFLIVFIYLELSPSIYKNIEGDIFLYVTWMGERYEVIIWKNKNW